MTDLNCVVSEEEIARGVSDLARRISEDYKDRDLVLVGVLNGAFTYAENETGPNITLSRNGSNQVVVTSAGAGSCPRRQGKSGGPSIPP